MRPQRLVVTGVAGGIDAGPRLFDPSFFGLAQEEGEEAARETRLFLERGWEALERAAWPVRRPRARRVLVQLDVPPPRRHARCLFPIPDELVVAEGGLAAEECLRRACAALRAGECELALVGGYLDPGGQAERRHVVLAVERADGAEARAVAPRFVVDEDARLRTSGAESEPTTLATVLEREAHAGERAPAARVDPAPTAATTAPDGTADVPQLLRLSARSDGALDAACAALAERFAAHEGPAPAEAAYTLSVARRSLPRRCAFVCRSRAEAASILAGPERARLIRTAAGAPPDGLVFLFPGGGTQYVGMARGLLEAKPEFRRHFERCARILDGLGLDLAAALRPGEPDADPRLRLERTPMTLAALFSVEYSLARLCTSWGLRPAAMIGHSLGEYVVACLAGVFELEAALRIVVARGRLFDELSVGSMASVPLPAEEVEPLLGPELGLAAVNAPGLCVVAGPVEAVARLKRELAGRAVEARLLHVERAGHCRCVDPIVDAFVAEVARFPLAAPRLPYLSNVTGTWIRAEEARDPAYWGRHLRSTVLFSRAVEHVHGRGRFAFLELGPGDTLGTLVRRHARSAGSTIVSALPQARDVRDEREVLLRAVASLWVAGIEVDEDAFFAHRQRRLARLPSHPFDAERRAWLERACGRAPYAAPRGRLESALASAAGRMLGGPYLGVHDDLVLLGWTRDHHAVLARAAGVELGVDVPPRVLYGARSLAESAERVLDHALEGASKAIGSALRSGPAPAAALLGGGRA